MEDKKTSSDVELIAIVLTFIIVFCGGFFLANKIRSRDDFTAKTVSCKVVDEDTGTKKCKLRRSDGRTVVCIINKNEICDWDHANNSKNKKK